MTPPTRLDPKGRFIEHSEPALLTLHRDRCADPRFKATLECALVEMQCRQKVAVATDAAAAYYRVEGALTFIDILLNLGDKAPDKPSVASPQLTPV